MISQGTDFTGNADQEAWPWDTKANRALSSWDIRHYWSTNYLLDLPFGPGRTVGGDLTGIAGKLLEGWGMSGVITLTSGAPFTAGLGFDYAAALPQGGGGGQTPDLVPGKSNNPVLGGPDQYFDPLAFELPPLIPECAAPGATCTRRVFGTLGRHTLMGPGIATLDFSLLKSTKLTEAAQLQFRAEFFNLFNRANFRIPNTTVFTSANRREPTAGRITNTSTTSREIQLALKLVF